MTSQLNLDTLKCIRRHDLVGLDEPQIWIDGRMFFATALEKDGKAQVPGAPYEFTGEAKVELYEASGSAGNTTKKQIGSAYRVTEKNPPPSPMDFKTSGAHYTLTFSVNAVIRTDPTTA